MGTGCHEYRSRMQPPNRRLANSRASRFLFLLIPVLILNLGCRANKKYDLIEAELRTRDRELQETRAELDQLKLANRVYQQQGAPGCLPGAPAYHSSGPVPVMPLKEIVLGAGTGGIDDDRQAGDEALQIVVVPKDDEGSPVKVPGKLTVTAHEINAQGLKTFIGRWEVPPEQLRRGWRSGLFATGYFVPLQWDKLPTTNKVRVAVRLTTLDGQPYEADKDVTVRPLAAACPREPGDALPFPTDIPHDIQPPPPLPSSPRLGPPSEVPEMPSPARPVPASPTAFPRGSVEELPPPAARLGTVKPLP